LHNQTVDFSRTSETDSLTAISALQSTHGIKTFDLIITNAGICTFARRVKNVSASTIQEHFTTNTIGPLVLFQAALPLLSPLSTNPKFMIVSSVAGTIEYQPYLPLRCVESSE
jgi:norsolorinic acid ketoreductase